MDRKRLFSILLVVFIDLLGFSLILPLLPYYAETFNASKFTTGLLIAVYALMQLIGAPILGRLSDRFGRRPFYWSAFLAHLSVSCCSVLPPHCGCCSPPAFSMGSQAAT